MHTARTKTTDRNTYFIDRPINRSFHPFFLPEKSNFVAIKRFVYE